MNNGNSLEGYLDYNWMRFERRYDKKSIEDKKRCEYCGKYFDFRQIGTLSCRSYINYINYDETSQQIVFVKGSSEQREVITRRFTICNGKPLGSLYYIDCDHRTLEGESIINSRPYIVMPKRVAENTLHIFSMIEYKEINKGSQIYQLIDKKELLKVDFKLYTPTWDPSVRALEMYLTINIMKEYLCMVTEFNLIDIKQKTDLNGISSTSYYQYKSDTQLESELDDNDDDDKEDILRNTDFVTKKIYKISSEDYSNKVKRFDGQQQMKHEALQRFESFYIIRRSGFIIKRV